MNWMRLSCHDFEDNQVRLELFVLAYNLGNFRRRLALPQKGEALVVDHLTGEVRENLSQGGSTLAVCDLPDGRAGHAPTAFWGHPRTDSTTQASGHGVGMTQTNGDNAGKPDRDRDGLFASAPKAPPKTIWGKITVQ